MIILTAAAAISLTLGLLVPFLTEEEHENGWIDGTAILAAVIVVAVVNVMPHTRYKNIPNKNLYFVVSQ